ncbi:hypothetical protein HZC07_03630 [Candidatus Micrarchaeota archaeon]|nr:hypothetical protein [Candidatus Micrarchaeota archaeon]
MARIYNDADGKKNNSKKRLLEKLKKGIDLGLKGKKVYEQRDELYSR